MRQYPTDHRLWGLISGVLILPFAGVWLIEEGIGNLDRYALDAVIFALACVIVGWVVQALAVMCGVRLGGSLDSEQASDYDDAPRSNPPDA